MSDETPSVPNPPAKRKPGRPKKLSKKELAKLDPIEQAARMLSLDERACAHLAIEYSPEEAATVLMWDLEAVKEVLARPNVRLYIQRAEEKFLEVLAKARVRRLNKIKAIPANVEGRLMELALMDPSETGGKIDGQVKALLGLAKILGMVHDDDDLLKRKSPDELKEIIRQANSKMIEGRIENRPQ